MLLVKLVFLSSCLYMSYGSQSSEEVNTLLSSKVGARLLQKVVKEIYNEDKLQVIADLIREQQENIPNITLVGSQNVYGPNGEIAEIRTVELHIPQIITNSFVGFSANNKNEDDEDDEMFAALKVVFDVVSKLGLSMEVAAEEYNKTGSLLSSAFIEKDLWYGYIDGVHCVNKTIEVDTSKTADDKIKELQAKDLKVAVLRFDGNGQFLSENSTILPEYAVSVISEDGDVDQQTLDEAQKGLATIFLKYRNSQDEVPSKLSEYLSEKYPEYEFNVFLNVPDAWYLNKDYKIELRFELTDWNDSKETIYSIFALKK